MVKEAPAVPPAITVKGGRHQQMETVPPSLHAAHASAPGCRSAAVVPAATTAAVRALASLWADRLQGGVLRSGSRFPGSPTDAEPPGQGSHVSPRATPTALPSLPAAAAATAVAAAVAPRQRWGHPPSPLSSWCLPAPHPHLGDTPCPPGQLRVLTSLVRVLLTPCAPGPSQPTS